MFFCVFCRVFFRFICSFLSELIILDFFVVIFCLIDVLLFVLVEEFLVLLMGFVSFVLLGEEFLEKFLLLLYGFVGFVFLGGMYLLLFGIFCVGILFIGVDGIKLLVVFCCR